MLYPKPLSEKSLAKMYSEANINEEKSEFLHKFFLAAANLYGTIVLRDLWDILKQIAEQYGMTGIKRKDLIAFSSIVRRETQPYYVYEIDELYAAEKRSELGREIVHKSIVKAGFDKKAWYYALVEMQGDKPYYIPKDMLSYAAQKTTAAEDLLLRFLKRLKVTARKAKTPGGKTVACEHVGETLGSFSFRNSDEDYEYCYFNGELDWHPSKNERAVQELLERTGCSEAEKIFRRYKEECNIGAFSPAHSLEAVFEELCEVGVQLSDKEFNKLTNLLVQFNNVSRLWCNCGWSPSELSELESRTGPTSISLGPGILKMIEEGKLDREEIEAELRRRGITLIE